MKYPLDLSALAYPLMRTRKTQSNFHFSIELTSPVDPDILTKSLSETLSRYPVLQTRVAPSFFWHVLKQNDAPLVVKKDERPPLLPLRDEDTNRYPFRLAYEGNKIVWEVFHAVTDANVGAMFVCDLLTCYAAFLKGESPVLPERDLAVEDAFLRYGKKKRLKDISLKKYNGASVYALGKKGKYRPYPELLSCELPLADIKAAAKDFGATLTEYIAALYIKAILEGATLPLKKDLCLFIPVDLRRFFPSKTMQNFVCFERIYLKKGENDISLPHLIDVVQREFNERITEKSMQDHVDDVVRCFTLPPVNRTPLFIKSPCFKLAKAVMNKVRQTAILSNIGTVTLPEQAYDAVKSVKFFLNIGKNAPVNLAVNTFNDVCHVNVTNDLTDQLIPARFFALLQSQGKK